MENLFDRRNVQYEKSCGAVVYRKFKNEYKVLLINFQHENNNIWGFPKGHMETDETEIQTAVREVCEETGLSVEINHDFRVSTRFSLAEGKMIEVIYFAATAKEIETKAQLGEVLICEWCKFSKARELLTFDCDRKILEKFINYFNLKELI